MTWNINDPEKLEAVVLELRSELARKIRMRRGMTVVDVGCGQGGFTVSVAKIVTKKGKVLSVDISDEYLAEFIGSVNKHNVTNIVTFIQADAANLKDFISDDYADMVVSYRFLEELKHPKDMARIIKEMARIAKKNGKVSLIELDTEARNEAEENYIRLHRESGDSLFESHEIVKAMREAELKRMCFETFETNIWFSPELAKQDLSLAQVWFTSDVKTTLGTRIEKYGMKYPRFRIFSGFNQAQLPRPS